MRVLVLDAGALIALERRDGRMLALLREVLEARVIAHVTAGVLAQVWRASPRQHAIRRLLNTEAVRVHAMTEETAYALGRLLAASRTSDVVDAHVAMLARSLGAMVLTSDPDDLRRIDARLELLVL